MDTHLGFHGTIHTQKLNSWAQSLAFSALQWWPLQGWSATRNRWSEGNEWKCNTQFIPTTLEPSIQYLEPHPLPTSTLPLALHAEQGRFASSTTPLSCRSRVARSFAAHLSRPARPYPPPLTSASILDPSLRCRGLKPSTSTLIAAISAQPTGTNPTRIAARFCDDVHLHHARRSVRATAQRTRQDTPADALESIAGRPASAQRCWKTSTSQSPALLALACAVWQRPYVMEYGRIDG